MGNSGDPDLPLRLQDNFLSKYQGWDHKRFIVQCCFPGGKNTDLSGITLCFPVYFVLDMFIIKKNPNTFKFVIFKLRVIDIDLIQCQIETN